MYCAKSVLELESYRGGRRDVVGLGTALVRYCTSVFLVIPDTQTIPLKSNLLPRIFPQPLSARRPRCPPAYHSRLRYGPSCHDFPPRTQTPRVTTHHPTHHSLGRVTPS